MSVGKINNHLFHEYFMGLTNSFEHAESQEVKEWMESEALSSDSLTEQMNIFKHTLYLKAQSPHYATLKIAYDKNHQPQVKISPTVPGLIALSCLTPFLILKTKVSTRYWEFKQRHNDF